MLILIISWYEPYSKKGLTCLTGINLILISFLKKTMVWFRTIFYRGISKFLILQIGHNKPRNELCSFIDNLSLFWKEVLLNYPLCKCGIYYSPTKDYYYFSVIERAKQNKNYHFKMFQ